KRDPSGGITPELLPEAITRDRIVRHRRGHAGWRDDRVHEVPAKVPVIPRDGVLAWPERLHGCATNDISMSVVARPGCEPVRGHDFGGERRPLGFFAFDYGCVPQGVHRAARRPVAIQ